MKKETLELLEKFWSITSVRPKSAMLCVGSMRGFVRLTLPWVPGVKHFCSWENYYNRKERKFHRVEIKFLGNDFDDDWHNKYGKDVYVEISKLKEL